MKSTGRQICVQSHGSEWVKSRHSERAAVCCIALCQPTFQYAKDTLEGYGKLNFDKVILSPFAIPPIHPRILVATAVDICACGESKVLTSYVAFKGSSDLEKTMFDAAKGKLEHEGPPGKKVSMKGSIHNGIYKELLEQLPSPVDILTFCDKMALDSALHHRMASDSAKQAERHVIFCGHGLSGALSHVAMLSLLFYLHKEQGMLKNITDGGTTFQSIGFGAPHFLDEEARDYFSSSGSGGVNLASRFFTYNNEHDPVPRLLNELRADPVPSQTQAYNKLNVHMETFFKDARGEVLRLQTGEPREPAACEDLTTRIEELRKSNMQRRPSPSYAAFGQFSRLPGEEISTNPRFSGLVWTRDCFKNHALSLWNHALAARDQRWDSERNIHEGSSPIIRSASFTVGETGKVNDIFVTVLGSNLDLCVRKRCQISLFEDGWEIKTNQQGAIVIRNKTQLKLEDLENGLTVKIASMFGETGFVSVVKTEVGADSHVINGLKRIVGKIVFLNSVVGGGPTERSFTKTLKNDLMSVAGKIRSAEDIDLVRRFNSDLESKQTVVAQRKAGKDFIDKVAHHLHETTLEVKLPALIENEKGRSWVSRVGLSTALTGLGAGISLVVVFAVISAATFGIGAAVAGGAGIGMAISTWILLHRGRSKIEGYLFVLQYIRTTMLLAAAPLEHCDEQAYLKGEHSIAYHEEAIIKLAKGGNWEKNLSSALRYQSSKTRESVMDLVNIILEVDNLEQRANAYKMLAVVGPENTGKSTLINILVHGIAPHADEDGRAPVGHVTHTDEPTAYCARNVENIIVVDFPGTNAADKRRENNDMWELFERFPDVCVVMLKFNGDVTRECGELPRLVRNRLCDKIVLIVNQVDSILKGPPRSAIWREYSRERVTELRKEYIKNSDIKLHDVLLTCLAASEDLYDSEKELLRERGILFAEDVLERIRRVVQEK